MFPMTLLTQTCKLSFYGLSLRLCKASKIRHVQVAYISSKGLRKNRPLKPPPYPYFDKNFNTWDQIFDPVVNRFDENSKLLVVEGPPAAGKTKFAQQLADELEMLYIPAPSFDEVYKTAAYGFDRRDLDKKYNLPPSLQTCDIEKFLKDPFHINVAAFQIQHYVLKMYYYMWATLHVLSTGQGVILNRCMYSDWVFMKAMMKAGYVSEQAFDHHQDVNKESNFLLWRPHLVIYLDVPVDVVKQRIKKRAIPYEVNSKALTDQYLTDIETIYKTEYLPKISKHSMCLSYDYTKEMQIEDVVLDIEKLDFDCYTADDYKLHDWHFTRPSEINSKRVDLHKYGSWMLHSCNISRFDVEELYVTGEEDERLETLTMDDNAMHYLEGWNPHFDKGLLWKTKDVGFYERFRKYIPQSSHIAKQLACST